MFNNIIYFIIIILIFTVHSPEHVLKENVVLDLPGLFITWAVFALYCRWRLFTLLEQINNRRISQSQGTSQYHQAMFRLSVLAIILFAVAVYAFNLKSWIGLIPGNGHFTILQGIFALSVFFIYLCTIWYFGYPVHRAMLRQDITRRAFIRSHVQLNVPIILPWVVISLAYDIIAMTPWGREGGLLSGPMGNVIFFSGFLLLLMIFMPAVIPYWWGCKPLPPSAQTGAMKSFLQQRGFRYRKLLNWPILQGRLMTAGIMGLVPRFRYILVTDALIKILTIEELKAVLAHEMGHAKYRHLLFYIFFFMAFLAMCLGFQELVYYILLLNPIFLEMFANPDTQSTDLFYLILSIPMLLFLLFYFRFIMGFFMRNFERQADLYSARLMGTASPIKCALEKIAFYSGKTRDLPSWHHFSIRERIDCLRKNEQDTGLFRRHNRFLVICFVIYLIGVTAAACAFNFGPWKNQAIYAVAEQALNKELAEDTDNAALYEELAMVCHELGKYQKAAHAYEKVLEIESKRANALNNLAWLLVTDKTAGLRDVSRGLELAKQAVAVERSAVFLDTLAEAYYANGMIPEAIRTIKEAIATATENRKYYLQQLEKFKV